VTLPTIESIEWHAVTTALPESDTTVLVWVPGAEVSLWLGFYDAESKIWISVTGAMYADENEIPEPVVAWAFLPKGPP
jgi:hypothetical protein